MPSLANYWIATSFKDYLVEKPDYNQSYTSKDKCTPYYPPRYTHKDTSLFISYSSSSAEVVYSDYPLTLFKE